MVDLFKSRVKDAELVFADQSKLGAKEDGSILNIHFFPDSTVTVSTYGNGFSSYRGEYELRNDSTVVLKFKNQRWPTLKITEKNGVILLKREDGKSSLGKYIVSSRKPDGSEILVDDYDIYPEAKNKIFPMIEK